MRDDNVASSEPAPRSRPRTLSLLQKSEGNRELPDGKFGFDGSMVREAGRIYGFGNRRSTGFKLQGLCGVQGPHFAALLFCCWMEFLEFLEFSVSSGFLVLEFLDVSCCWIYPDLEALVIAPVAQFHVLVFCLEELLLDIPRLRSARDRSVVPAAGVFVFLFGGFVSRWLQNSRI
jgi:hypothetical protein